MLGIVYASSHGHTAKIAARLAEAMRAEGVDVEVAEVGEEAERLIPRWDAALLAGSVHRGGHQPELVDFVRRHHFELQGMPSAFVSVSLTAGEEEDELRAETRRVIDEFVEDTGWTPDVTAPVAGSFQFSKYDTFERLIMRLIARRHGVDIDPHTDLDLTDWDAVEQLGRDFVRRLRRHGALAGG